MVEVVRPFAAGPLPDLPAQGVPEALPADPPDATLDTLYTLDVHVGKTPMVELLRPIYETIVHPRRSLTRSPTARSRCRRS